MKELFSMQGRVNRQKYFFIQLAVAFIASAFSVGFLYGFAGAGEQATTAAAMVIGVVSGIVWSFLVVKRLHDLGKPGWHFWLLYVPFYGIYLAFVLLFAKGAAAPNQFGEDPCRA